VVKGRATEQYRAANAYAAIRNEGRYLHCVECKKGKSADQLDDMLKTLRQQLVKLDEQTPIISANAMTKAETKIKAGDYIYAVDAGSSKPT
jgi:hypothetical protein